jgi:hypothetical protein
MFCGCPVTRLSPFFPLGIAESGKITIKKRMIADLLGVSLLDILPLVNEGDSLLRLGTLCRLFDGFLLRRGVP